MTTTAETEEAVCPCHCCHVGGVASRVVPGYGSAHADVMIVGDIPSADDLEHGRPFSGKIGGLVDSAMAEAGLDPNSVRFDNVTLCRPREGKFPSDPATVAHCVSSLLCTVATVLPRVLVVLGANAHDALFKSGVKITERRGTVYTLNFHTPQMPIAALPAVLTYHPAFVSRSGGTAAEEYRQFVSDLAKAKAIATTQQPIPELFDPFLAQLSSPIRDVVTEVLTRAPDGFFTAATSSTGKYHPPWANEPAGLLLHSAAVSYLARQIVQEMGRSEYGDIVAGAGLIHDAAKGGWGNRSDYKMHPENVAGIAMVAALRLGVHEDPAIVAMVGALATHMGQWGAQDKKPRTWCELALALADLALSNPGAPHPLRPSLDATGFDGYTNEYARLERYTVSGVDELMAAARRACASLRPGFLSGALSRKDGAAS